MEALVAWPTAVLILGIISLLLFRKDIVSLLARMSSASKEGVKFGGQQELAAAASPPIIEQGSSFEELMRSPISKSVLEREEKGRDFIGKQKFASDAERISFLIRVASSASLDAEFWRISGVIFGSQVELLGRASGSLAGLTAEDVTAIFASAQATYPAYHTGRNVEEWLGFVLNHKLVQKPANASNKASLEITQRGTDFLKFLIDYKANYPRAG